VSDGYDICLWLGDFNYRINLTLNEIRGYLYNQRKIYESIPHLIKYDQMKQEKDKGNLFINKFKEGTITFPPTYKLIPGTDDYVLEEGGDRIPGWADRILYHKYNCRFKSKPDDMLEIKEYNSILKIMSSDHKPVFAIFELDLRKSVRKSEEILDK
jgi:phosphatidylinositol-bisphosphatase